MPTGEPASTLRGHALPEKRTIATKTTEVEPDQGQTTGHWGSDAGQSFTYTHFQTVD